MRMTLGALTVALLLSAPAALALADDDSGGAQADAGRAVGCAYALSATISMPGWVFVRAACDQTTAATQGQADDQAAAGAAAAEQGVATGCAIAVAQTAGTPGAAYVQWGCARAESAVQGAVAPDQSVVVPPSPPPPVDGRAIGCARALAAVSGTAGEPYVRAHCG